MRYLVITTLLFMLVQCLQAQVIVGVVTDKKKEPITNASVAIKQKGILKGGAITDINGKYLVRLADTGRYDVTVCYLGLQTTTVTKVNTSWGDTALLNFVMEPERHIYGYEVIHIPYCIPRLQPYKTSYSITTAQMRGVNMMK